MHLEFNLVEITELKISSMHDSDRITSLGVLADFDSVDLDIGYLKEFFMCHFSSPKP